MNRGNNITLIGKLNRAEVYEYLFKNGDSSIQQIASEIGLSLPAVTRAIEVGLNQGLFASKGLIGGDRGRKAMYYGLNADCGHSISIYIGSNTITVKLKDFTAENMSAEIVEISDNNLIQLIEEIIEKYRKRDDRLKFIFVILSGDVHEGKVVYCAAHKELNGLDLKYHLIEKFNMITIVENDMVASVTAGFKYADNPKNEIIVTYLFGKNIYGAGVMINNVPYKGANGRQMSLGELSEGKHHRQTLSLVAEKLESVIVLFNPHTVILYASDDSVTCDALIKKVKDDLPNELIPTFYERHNFIDTCITGMVRLCIEEIKYEIRESDSDVELYKSLLNFNNPT